MNFLQDKSVPTDDLLVFNLPRMLTSAVFSGGGLIMHPL